jgi:hypothetical protein
MDKTMRRWEGLVGQIMEFFSQHLESPYQVDHLS